MSASNAAVNLVYLLQNGQSIRMVASQPLIFPTGSPRGVVVDTVRCSHHGWQTEVSDLMLRNADTTSASYASCHTTSSVSLLHDYTCKLRHHAHLTPPLPAPPLTPPLPAAACDWQQAVDVCFGSFEFMHYSVAIGNVADLTEDFNALPGERRLATHSGCRSRFPCLLACLT